MLTLRLSRIGKKNKPMYRLIVSEKARDPYGRALEILGSYNPFSKEIQAKNDRIIHWLSQGASMSPSVNNLLIEKGIITGKKVKASKNKEAAKKEEPAAAVQTQEAKPEAKEQPAPAADAENKEEKIE